MQVHPRTEGRSLPREFVSNHLDIDLFTHIVPYTAHKVLVDPWLKLAHPIIGISITCDFEAYSLKGAAALNLSNHPPEVNFLSGWRQQRYFLLR